MRNIWIKAAFMVAVTGCCFAGQTAPKNEEMEQFNEQTQEGELTFQPQEIEQVKETPVVRKSAAQKAREAEEAYYK